MKELWQKYSDQFNGRAIRERIILALCLFAVVYGVFYYGFFFPLDVKKAAIQKRLDDLGKESEKLSAQEIVFAQAIENDPNAEKKRELTRLSQQLKFLDEDLMKLSVGLISAEQLPIALRDVLLQSKGLELLGLEAQAPSKLALSEPPKLDAGTSSETSPEKTQDELNGQKNQKQKEASSQEANRGVGLYKHAVKLAIEGEYFTVVDYLKSIEELPWKIYWQTLDYQVQDYPRAKVVLEVYTLSTEKGFIGG
ncbi:hypothetical protein TDB9533_02403 [Thalassocella blandensis]|nr:hypothetical protein TDB9533_02403 [Thalassocella blandensis]